MKSKYLGGKRNWRVDFILKTLTDNVQSDLNNRHRRQAIGLEGRDLRATRRDQILATAKQMSLDSIYQVSNTEFLVASESRPGHRYPIDLTELTCDCNDFPRIRFCKHIAAVNVHFPQLFPKESSSSDIPELRWAQDPPQTALESDADEDEERAILLKDINKLYQQLIAVSDDTTRDRPDLQALRSVKHSLNTAIASATGCQPLPERDNFNPTEKIWPITLGTMGARKSPKRKPGPAIGNTTEQSIGAIKGKRRNDSDPNPYAAGERSGKRAKPDAVSAAANERARATVPAPPPQYVALPAPARASPSAAAASSAEGYLIHANQSIAVPPAYPSSSVAPAPAFSPFPAALPGRVFAPPSTAIPRFAYTGIDAQRYFRAEILPGNALARTHFPPGPLDLVAPREF